MAVIAWSSVYGWESGTLASIGFEARCLFDSSSGCCIIAGSLWNVSVCFLRVCVSVAWVVASSAYSMALNKPSLEYGSRGAGHLKLRRWVGHQWAAMWSPGPRNRPVGQYAQEGLLGLTFINDSASQCPWAARGPPKPRNRSAGQYAQVCLQWAQFHQRG